MTPQQIDAMKLALEALEGFYEYGYDRQECFEHITAIKEALAEHAMRETQRLGQEIEQERTWVGLTEQDLDYLCNLAYTGDEEFALAVQAKLMEKNA
jgi:hypothetical protein